MIEVEGIPIEVVRKRVKNLNISILSHSNRFIPCILMVFCAQLLMEVFAL